jgi:RND superfamily putative drug exporter
VAELLFRIGRFAARRRLVVGGTWLVILALAAAAYAVGGGPLTGQITIPGTPTDQVAQRLAAELPAAAGSTGTVVFHTEDGSAFTDAQMAAISAMVADASGIDGVKQAVDPFATEAQREAQAQQIQAGQAQIDAGQAQIDQAQAQLDAARAQAEAAGQLDQAQAQLDAQQAQVDAGQAQVDAARQQLQAGSALLQLASGIRLVSEDGSTALVPVQFTGSQMEVSTNTQHAVIDTFESTAIPGVAVDFSSSLTLSVPNILGPGELVGVLIAAIVLFIMLGTLVGAGLPIVTALLGVGIGVLGALSLASVVDMVSVTPVLGVMLGLAVGIDYALFIVNRHRHQLREGYEVEESIALANGTSGNAVVFAGSTVVIALLALNVTGIPFLGLMGTVGAACVAIAVLISVTLTPALLSLIGMRILSRREIARLGTPEHRPSAAGARALPTPRALAQVVVGVAVLAVLAVPVTSMRLGLPDGSWEASSSTEYQAYTIIADKFGPGQNGPLVVVADLPGTPAAAQAAAAQLQVAQQIAAFKDVAAVAPIGTSTDGTMVAFQVVPTEGPSSASTEQLVSSLRDASPLQGGIEIGVAGATSGSIDISQMLADALPLYLALVVGLSLLIMILVFRSILLPVIATGGFVLSLLATLGGLVVIIQWGWLSGLLGVAQPIPILNFLPTVLAGILFGLAMDYTLFLASGMREAYVHGASPRIAVVLGFRAGRSVVTAAALIMISVFGAFVFSESTIIRPIGFALAFGVLIDAFVVRMLILPGVMHLAGRWAWWLPRWLDRLLPNVDVEGAALERRHPHVADEHLAEQPAGGQASWGR